jgi:gamma-glutamyltranspeptidase/glutathione hydrolase
MIVLRDGATGEILNVDNYAVAPGAAREDMFVPLQEGEPYTVAGRENEVGHRSAGVPGALQAWTALLRERGRLPLAEVLAPAVRYAGDGFTVSPYLAQAIRGSAADLARFPASAAVFLPGGAPLEAGSRLVRRDYAATLERIGAEGPAVFTEGAIAAAVAADMERHGGLITVEDLARYRPQRREAVRGTYRGYEVVSAAPVSSGGTHLVQCLNILERFDVAGLGFGTAPGVHLLAEALKIAFADRARYVGDPAFVDVPVAWLTDKGYGAARAAEISPHQARRFLAGEAPPEREGAHTTHLTAMDAGGTVVTMTQTLHAHFGSKVTVPGTGMLLNNTMWLFDPHPGRANSIAPGKRMRSSMAPTIVLRDGVPRFALGTPGATRIFPAVLQAVLNVIDHGMTLQEAVEAPRVWTDGGPLEVEPGIAPDVRAGLAALGHEVRPVARVAGGMNGTWQDPHSGALGGAACWRADGTPVGIGGGPAQASPAGV